MEGTMVSIQEMKKTDTENVQYKAHVVIHTPGSCQPDNVDIQIGIQLTKVW